MSNSTPRPAQDHARAHGPGARQGHRRADAPARRANRKDAGVHGQPLLHPDRRPRPGQQQPADTGNQIITQASASKDDLLAAVSTLVRGGLADDWDDDAAKQLAQAIDGREDITIEDVCDAARGAAEAEQAEPGKVKALLAKIAVGATSGVLSTGVIAALGGLF